MGLVIFRVPVLWGLASLTGMLPLVATLFGALPWSAVLQLLIITLPPVFVSHVDWTVARRLMPRVTPS